MIASYPAMINIEYNDQEYVAHVFIECYIDKNYGADADGNRGIEKIFYQGVKIIFVSMNGEEVELSLEIEVKIENEVAEKWMEMIP